MSQRVRNSASHVEMLQRLILLGLDYLKQIGDDLNFKKRTKHI